MTRRVADEVNLEGSSFEGYHQPIKGYEILERIGSGGMGSVYKAKQASLERVVALKVLRKDRMDDPRSLERLHKEARLLARLDHPNIVRSIDMGEMGPYVYFAMELVDGRSVKDVIVENGPLADLAAVRIVEKVALALEYAAAEGITHRDVKPGNILLGRGGVVKLSDFGLAMGPIDTGTRSGTLGTPQYISPEQGAPSQAHRRALGSVLARLDLLPHGHRQVPFPGDSVAR
jgi:serine/threonine-protein kinase